ncbi:MAG: hypothetical protein ACR2OI_09250 [Acidimicrobiia bacterium]
MMFVGFAHPVFAWVGIGLLLAFGLSMMWKAAKTAMFLAVLAVISWIVFFAG